MLLPEAQCVSPEREDVVARYFFTRTNDVFDPDYEGLVLADDSEAKLEAVSFAGDTLKFGRLDLCKDGQLRIEVRNERQCVIFAIQILLTSVNPDEATSLGEVS